MQNRFNCGQKRMSEILKEHGSGNREVYVQTGDMWFRITRKELGVTLAMFHGYKYRGYVDTVGIWIESVRYVVKRK